MEKGNYDDFNKGNTFGWEISDIVDETSDNISDTEKEAETSSKKAPKKKLFNFPQKNVQKQPKNSKKNVVKETENDRKNVKEETNEVPVKQDKEKTPEKVVERINKTFSIQEVEESDISDVSNTSDIPDIDDIPDIPDMFDIPDTEPEQNKNTTLEDDMSDNDKNTKKDFSDEEMFLKVPKSEHNTYSGDNTKTPDFFLGNTSGSTGKAAVDALTGASEQSENDGNIRPRREDSDKSEPEFFGTDESTQRDYIANMDRLMQSRGDNNGTDKELDQEDKKVPEKNEGIFGIFKSIFGSKDKKEQPREEETKHIPSRDYLKRSKHDGASIRSYAGDALTSIKRPNNNGVETPDSMEDLFKEAMEDFSSVSSPSSPHSNNGVTILDVPEDDIPDTPHRFETDEDDEFEQVYSSFDEAKEAEEKKKEIEEKTKENRLEKLVERQPTPSNEQIAEVVLEEPIKERGEKFTAVSETQGSKSEDRKDNTGKTVTEGNNNLSGTRKVLPGYLSAAAENSIKNVIENAKEANKPLGIKTQSQEKPKPKPAKPVPAEDSIDELFDDGGYIEEDDIPEITSFDDYEIAYDDIPEIILEFNPKKKRKKKNKSNKPVELPQENEGVKEEKKEEKKAEIQNKKPAPAPAPASLTNTSEIKSSSPAPKPSIKEVVGNTKQQINKSDGQKEEEANSKPEVKKNEDKIRERIKEVVAEPWEIDDEDDILFL